MTQEHALTLKQEGGLPATFKDIQGMAEAFVKSGMFEDTK